jgi:hypothetical protein
VGVRTPPAGAAPRSIFVASPETPLMSGIDGIYILGIWACQGVEFYRFTRKMIVPQPFYATRSGGFYLGGIMRFFPLVICALSLAACAGRDPEPIPTVQPWDAQASCTQIRAEIEANNLKVKQLADEQGLKVAQNVAAGAAGFFTFGLTWFAMDAKGAANKDVVALQSRQQYLSVLAEEKCSAKITPVPEKKR